MKKVYVHTSTYLIRSDLYKRAVAQYVGKKSFSDTALRYILTDMSPFVQLKEIVLVYRQTSSGVWALLGRIQQIEREIELAKSFYKTFDGNISNNVVKSCVNVMDLCISRKIFV